MTDKIFPGLGQPKCQLYFDLQAMIAKHGGRLHLTDILENEMVKLYLPKCENLISERTPWSNYEIEYLKNNYKLFTDIKIAEFMNRTRQEISSKLHALYRQGLNKRNV